MTNVVKGRLSAEIDRHVAVRIRERRRMLGISQKDFGILIGVNYRQAYKYEHALTRVSASMLYSIAKTLRVSVDYFYQRLDGRPERRLDEYDLLAETMRNFSVIRNERLQAAFCDLVRLLAESDEEKISHG